MNFEDYIKDKYPDDYAYLKDKYPLQSIESLYASEFEAWDYQQSIIEDLKIQVSARTVMMDKRKEERDIFRKQLDCCRGENKAHLEKIDELQARVDRVVHILTYTNHASTPLCNELCSILKGNKDD